MSASLHSQLHFFFILELFFSSDLWDPIITETRAHKCAMHEILSHRWLKHYWDWACNWKAMGWAKKKKTETCIIDRRGTWDSSRRLDALIMQIVVPRTVISARSSHNWRVWGRTNTDDGGNPSLDWFMPSAGVCITGHVPGAAVIATQKLSITLRALCKLVGIWLINGTSHSGDGVKVHAE